MQAADFLAWLVDAPVVRRMDPARLVDYGARFAEIQADLERSGDAQTLFRLAQKMYALGDETAALTLAQHVHARGDGLLRYRAAARAGRCLYELGLTREAREMMEAAIGELARGEPDSPLLAVLDNMLGNACELDGMDVEAEHHYQKTLRTLRRISDAQLHAAGFSSRWLLEHPPRMNLCEIAIKRAERLAGPARERLLGAVHGQLDEGLARPEVPTEFLGMYHILRARAFTAGERFAESAERLAGLEAPVRVSPDMNWCLPILLRERGRLHARRCDPAAAYRDLRAAMHESLSAISVIEERTVVAEIFRVLAGMHGGGERVMMDEFDENGPARGLMDEILGCLEQKDWYTGKNHSRAVARLAGRIADRLPECADLDRRALTQGALLHDIGKLSIPWSLLNKTAPLTGWERGYLQGHAEAGERLLAMVGLNTAAQIAGGHHRHFSGGGYPDTRPVNDPATEIVAVADAFEAMITPTRRYRSAKSVPDAVAEILRCAPGQFSPRAAQALAKLYPAA